MMTLRQTLSVLRCLAALLCVPFLLLAQTDFIGVKNRLAEVIQREMAQKQLPAVYLVLVDSQSVVWSAAFGTADAGTKTPARPTDVLRVAPFSKLFTDIGVMQLAEQGLVDLDAPVSTYLHDFHPRNPFDTPITLRALMSHRAGLEREPPVGNYFDPTQPSLEQTVASLNSTSLLYKPGTEFKFSNAGVAVAGEVLERVRGKSFPHAIEETVIRPLGLTGSSFEPRPDLMKRLSKGVLWTYDGRTLDAPTFRCGTAPAENLYSTLDDLALFIKCLFNKGNGTKERILSERSLEEMWTPQSAPSGQVNGIGLGFFIGSIDGHRKISHSDNVYGFAADFAALPDDRIGVVVVNTMNGATAWSTSIAEFTLRLMLAARLHQPLPDRPATHSVDPQIVKSLSGKYIKGTTAVRFHNRPGGFFLQGKTTRTEVRQIDGNLVIDDKLSEAIPIVLLKNAVVIGADTLQRAADDRPQPPPDRWRGLIGEYGWDHNTLYIQERDGILHALIEWYYSYPLIERSQDFFEFPDFGFFKGEHLQFTRDAEGRATQVSVGNVVFARRSVGTDDGSTFHIVRQRPVGQLRKEALAATPPHERGQFRSPDLVELVKLDSTIKLDIRYATTNNFMSTIFYSQPKAFMQRPAAEAVVRASRWLRQRGFGLLVHDSYRPWYVTKMFWDATPVSQRDFVANPADGSRHNRGCAVDITLYDLATGKPVSMVSGYDEFSNRAFPEYPGGTSLQQWDRELLRAAMESQGFTVYVYEWWHFDFKDWRQYPILNLTFDQVSEVNER